MRDFRQCAMSLWAVSHLQPPLWHHGELCVGFQLYGRGSRTTRGHELMRCTQWHCQPLTVPWSLTHSDIVTSIPLFCSPNSQWKAPISLPYPGASWALIAAWKAFPQTAGPPGRIWKETSSYTPETNKQNRWVLTSWGWCHWHVKHRGRGLPPSCSGLCRRLQGTI